MNRSCRVLYLSLILLSSFLLGPGRVQATATLPIDVLQEKVLKPRKSPTLKTLREAYEKLRDGRYSDALKKALAARREKETREYGDYTAWIAATAEIDLARKSCAEKKFGLCKSASQTAIDRLIDVLEHYPYSPLLKGLSKEIALAELVGSGASCGKKEWVPCRKTMEGAFQRLAASGDLGLLRPEFLQAYGQACGNKPSDLCQSWILRLSSFFPRNSAELKALSKNAGALLDQTRPSYGSARSTRSYKAPDLDQTAFDEAMAKYFNQKWGDAAKGFRQFLDDFPRSSYRYRAQYWLAQSLGQDQKHEDARKLYEQLRQESPLSYYGLLASLALGQEIGTVIEATLPQAAPTDPSLTPQELIRLKRAEALLSARAFALAAMELRDIRARDTLSSPFLMYLAMLNHEARNHPVSFSIIGELIQRGYEGIYSSYVLRLIFPTPYTDLIDKRAEESNLDPILVLSLMKQESAFDSAANSGAGAQGLMQVMHATALGVFPELARWELANAETNVLTGTRYLARLMNRFNGNMVLALAGYNAGPAAVERWSKSAPSKRGVLEFIESIPYKETREYVAGIIRNYYWYAHNLDENMPKTVSFFWNGPNPTGAKSAPLPQPIPSPEVFGPLPTGMPSTGPEEPFIDDVE